MLKLYNPTMFSNRGQSLVPSLVYSFGSIHNNDSIYIMSLIFELYYNLVFFLVIYIKSIKAVDDKQIKEYKNTQS